MGAGLLVDHQVVEGSEVGDALGRQGGHQPREVEQVHVGVSGRCGDVPQPLELLAPPGPVVDGEDLDALLEHRTGTAHRDTEVVEELAVGVLHGASVVVGHGRRQRGQDRPPRGFGIALRVERQSQLGAEVRGRPEGATGEIDERLGDCAQRDLGLQQRSEPGGVTVVPAHREELDHRRQGGAAEQGAVVEDHPHGRLALGVEEHECREPTHDLGLRKERPHLDELPEPNRGRSRGEVLDEPRGLGVGRQLDGGEGLTGLDGGPDQRRAASAPNRCPHLEHRARPTQPAVGGVEEHPSRRLLRGMHETCPLGHGRDEVLGVTVGDHHEALELAQPRPFRRTRKRTETTGGP